MASLTLDATKISIVAFSERMMHPGVVGTVAVTGGMILRLNTTTGKLEAAEGDSATTAGNIRWITPKSAAIGEALTVYRGALVDLGLDVLTALNFGAPLYLADDGGISATVGDSTTATIIGYVVPGWADGSTASKLMQMV